MSLRTSLLVVHQGSELYGSDRMLIAFLSALQNQHFDITLHMPSNGPLISHVQTFVSKIIIAPISVLRLTLLKSTKWLNLSLFYQNLMFASRLLKQYDSVLINSTVILTYLILLPFYRGRKYVYVHEITTGITNIVFNVILRMTGAILICNSQTTAKSYPFIPDQRKKIVYNSKSLPPSVHAKQNPDNVLNILLIGRLSYRKGQHVLLNALSLLAEQDLKRINVRIVGDSYNPNSLYAKRFTQTLAALSDTMTIQHLPFAPNPAKHYEWAHITITPSVKPESFGLTVLEAMQSKCVVIVSNIGALPELVMHDETGCVIPANNEKALADAIKLYLADPERIVRHGLAAEQRARDCFHPDLYQTTIRQVMHG